MKTDRIRELAKQNDLPLAFLCRRIGVAKVYFNDIDKSGRDIPEDKLSVLADILGTTPAYLKGETDKKEKPAITPDDELMAALKDPQIYKLVKQLKKNQKDYEYVTFESNIHGDLRKTDVEKIRTWLQT